MNKLLSADFSRMKRNITFWIICAASLIIHIVNVADSVKTNRMIDSALNGESFIKMLFQDVPVLAIVLSILITLFIGQEYSDATVRNKLIVGHLRKNIYISNYMVSLICSLVIYIFISLSGIPFIKDAAAKPKEVILYALIGVFSTMALVSIFTMLGMLATKRAISAVSAIVFGIALIFAASIIYNSLAEPEMTSGMEMTINGLQITEPKPNPFYIGGVQRKVYEFLLQFLPTGQGILLANEEITHPVLNLIYSAVLAVTVNICGIFTFTKKDIK